jgi:DNA-binding CsgD family transcriptional regulator/PAS domain-containing protein
VLGPDLDGTIANHPAATGDFLNGRSMNIASINVDEIITLIYQGTLEPKPWQSFLRCLRLQLDCDVAAISLTPARTGVRAITVWDRRYPISDADLKTATEEHARLANLDPLSNALRQPGDIYTLDDVISRAELMQSEYYQKVVKPFGNDYQLGMYLSEPHGWACQVGIINGADRRNFGEPEKQFFRQLRPHLEHALEVYSLLKRTELEKEIYEEALNRLTIGAIILNKRGGIIEINQAARNIAEQNDILSFTDSGISFSKSRYREEFSRIHKEASSWRDSARPYVAAMRVDAAAGDNLGLLVRSAPVSPWYQNDASPSVIVYLSDLDQQRTAPERFVSLLLGLTPVEALLAMALANGLTLSEAAIQLNITENTVRTYSKKIYAKLGINRQAELVRLILSSVVFLADTDKPAAISSKYCA